MHRLLIAAAIAFIAVFAQAQPAPSAPTGAAPTGLVVDSGNFFSPIVANLEDAVTFYRDGIGFEFQGEPGNADANPALRAMFGAKPVTLTPTELRAVVVQDPAGHFVQLLQPRNPPATQRGTGDIRNVRVRHTVADLDHAVALYRDALGLQGSRLAPARYETSPPVVDLLAVPPSTEWRYTTLNVPTSGLPIELIEFKGARQSAPPRIADPGAMQLRVADIDAAVAALAQAGGTFVSTGDKPLDLPAGNSTLKVGIVRDPDNLFLVLIDSPPPAPQ